MVCCLFGRTTNGLLDESCPAVLLHRRLAAKRVYVDLVARTESVAVEDTGRKTVSPLDLHIHASKFKLNDLMRRKTQFTKIRCTYQNGTGCPAERL